ncbi:MAG: MBL fold metallo-hydrolase [Chloroflexi bacterium]|nr:MBL fold metallo-hydrolase [Chloroflexota bacterium]
MKLTLLGTGTPVLEIDRQGPAVLLQIGEENWLFDTGRGVNTQLLRMGLTPAEIDAIFITHHHWDHIGDLGDVLIAAWHGNRTAPIHVYGPNGTQSIVAALLNHVYQREILFTQMLEEQIGNFSADIREIITVHDVEPGVVRKGSDYAVLTQYVNHGKDLLPQAEWPCLGYRIEAGDNIIAISGDTIPCSGLEKLAQGADILVQCCYLAEDEITTPDFQLLASKVIASSGQLAKFAAEANVKKLVLTHFRKKSEAMMQSMLRDIKSTFSGDVVLGEDLMQVSLPDD